MYDVSPNNVWEYSMSTLSTLSKSFRTILATSAFIGCFSAINTEAQTNCTLSWTPQNDPELAGHIVYAGTKPKQYRLSVELSAATTAISCDSPSFSTLPKPAIWCFTVTSINNSGFESTFSALTHVCTEAPIEPS